MMALTSAGGSGCGCLGFFGESVNASAMLIVNRQVMDRLEQVGGGRGEGGRIEDFGIFEKIGLGL